MNAPQSTVAAAPTESDLVLLRERVVHDLRRALETEHVPPDGREAFVEKRVIEVFDRAGGRLSEELGQRVRAEVLTEILGYGPIQALLDDPEITEIMVNGPGKVYVERKGRISRSEVSFQDDHHILRLIERIVAPLGRRVDARHPTVDARLPDGSRVNAVIPPVAIDGPALTIRKFMKDKLQVQDLIRLGALTDGIAAFLRACVLARFNVVISGGTGSGKTTLLNVLSGFIPESDRIVTIEDAAELQLQQEHVMRLETQAADPQGEGVVTIRDLVRNSLRMRPDRIIVGEVRGGEALDMLQAMNTGHEGSLTTLHANTPRDALTRLETLVMMAGVELPLKVIRQQISSAVDVIVQQSRLRDGERRITSVTEVAGMEGEIVILTDIFKFEHTGVGEDGKVLGTMRPTGIRPLFTPRLEAAGFKLGAEVFTTGLAASTLPRRPR